MAPVVFSRFWSLLAGPVTIYLYVRQMSREEQGYAYLFGSIIALRIFLELGVSQSVSTFVAHEAAHLRFGRLGCLVGSAGHLARLRALIRFFAKWYTVASLLFVITVGSGGWLFMVSRVEAAATGVSWQGPWLMVIAASGMNILILPLLSTLGGCGKVPLMNRINAINVFSLNIVTWGGLLVGWELYALGCGYLCAAIISAAQVICGQRVLWRQVFRCRFGEAKFSFWKEVFPFQWRISVSWMSGYFVNQIYTPAIFMLFGPAVAGQYGMTSNIFSMISSCAYAWVGAKQPALTQFNALGLKEKMGDLFGPAYIRSLVLSLIGLSLGGVAMWGASHLPLFNGRFLSSFLIIILALGYLMQTALLGMASFVRAHKVEPFISVAWIQAIIALAGVKIMGLFWGLSGIALAFTLCWLVGLPLVMRIFSPYWHATQRMVK